MVNPGPVKISGSVYPKSITFYCNVGDPTPFPKYTLKHNARRFQGTLGLAAHSPQQFRGILRLLGDGRTLQTVTVSVRKPKTVDVKVTGVHTLQLECFGSGNSYTGGEAVAVVWGNARVSGGH
jgi:NPCBM/NEW2 domain-containing protein